MALTLEEERALQYQRDQKKRIAYGKRMQALLKAPPEPAKQTKKNWEPLRRS